jgi:hypothetical protein
MLRASRAFSTPQATTVAPPPPMGAIVSACLRRTGLMSPPGAWVTATATLGHRSTGGTRAGRGHGDHARAHARRADRLS